MNIEKTINRIMEKTGESRTEIEAMVYEEMAGFNGLIDKEGALIIICKELGIEPVR